MGRRAKIGSAIALAFALALTAFALTASGQDSTVPTSGSSANPADLADELDKQSGESVEKYDVPESATRSSS